MSSCLYAIEFKDKTWKIGGSNNAILRLNNYKGPCKPVFCVVQVLEEYNSHESTLINNMKKSPEWELSDGNKRRRASLNLHRKFQVKMQRNGS
jgi:hypothetical protein